MEESLLHRNFELHYVLRIQLTKKNFLVENNTFNEETNMKE